MDSQSIAILAKALGAVGTVADIKATVDADFAALEPPAPVEGPKDVVVYRDELKDGVRRRYEVLRDGTEVEQ